MIETAARSVQFLLAIGIAYLVAVWFALIAWTFRDIESRSRSVFTQIFSTLLVVLFFLPGLALYLILRPKETLDQAFQRALEEEYLLQDLDDLPLCPGCQRTVDPEFVLCPHCQTHLRAPCPACTRLIDLRWGTCPYCAVAVDREAASARLSTEGVLSVEAGRVDRRKRAIAAAAQKVGIEGDELDALTDALSGATGYAAVGSGAGGGQSARRFPSLSSRIRHGFGVDDSRNQPPEHAEFVDPAGSGSLNRSPGNGGVESSSPNFWADPLPRTRAGRGLPPDESN